MSLWRPVSIFSCCCYVKCEEEQEFSIFSIVCAHFVPQPLLTKSASFSLALMMAIPTWLRATLTSIAWGFHVQKYLLHLVLGKVLFLSYYVVLLHSNPGDPGAVTSSSVMGPATWYVEDDCLDLTILCNSN